MGACDLGAVETSHAVTVAVAPAINCAPVPAASVASKISTFAVLVAASAPTVPASPTPLTPRLFSAVGVSKCSLATGGKSSARGMP